MTRTISIAVCCLMGALGGPPPGYGLAAPTTATQQVAGLPDARRALAEGRVEEATASLRRLADEHPSSALVALWLGHTLRRGGDRPGASREYLRALEIRPDTTGALIALGDLQQDASDLAGALGYYEHAVELAPELPVVHRKAAAVEVRRENHGPAARHLERYVELLPNDGEALTVLGIERYLNEELDAALESLERALAIDPDNAQAHFGVGLVLADRPAEHVRSLEHLRRAAAADPDNPTAHYLIGRVLAAQGELDPALAALQRALELAPELPDAHYRIALVYARLGDREAGRRHQDLFNELEQQQDAAAERDRRVGLLQQALSLAAAEADMQAVRDAAAALIAADPDDPDVLAVLARVALAEGDIEGGLRATTRALEAQPDHWEVLYLHGLLQHSSGRSAEARANLERSRQISPLYAPTHAALGNVLMHIGQPRDALPAYETAVRLAPDNAAYHLNLATAYGRLGMAEQEAAAMATHKRLLREPRSSEPR